MNNEQKLKLVGFLVIFIVVVNLILFVFTIINWTVFLVVLGAGYAFNKWGLPKLKEGMK
ncbi:hypothetical protein HOC13_00480 [Candidatus Woesearchaeota archaeon]|jgi:hypothetical protein|nr:hypothetical protein [Candidatus Woesearchaeota archaeon]